MVSRNTTLVPSLGLRIGPACEAGLSVGMRRERVPPQRIKIGLKTEVQATDSLQIPVFPTLFCILNLV